MPTNDTIKETHFNASSGYYTDTETTVTYHLGSNVVSVRIECLPYLQYWTCPDAKTLRNWVDHALKGTGKKRDGARISWGYRTNGWGFNYYLKNVEDK